MTDPRLQSILQDVIAGQRPSTWVTRERPKIDRIACPWAILRFIDANARILYAPTEDVFDVAEREHAVAFDIPGAPISHDGDLCSFDTLLRAFGLSDTALQRLALIVRGADTDRHELAPEAAGLHAISLGLSRNYGDDHALLAQGLVVYDALYAWATQPSVERHAWRPAV
ncbi:chromate resistance protein ChrB domain-containing protein [Vitreimonas flagellata]|uniref:chromate resistance protein ChrB domain-containing protein n=1 Tax=Vitreimonas flagellata TaxID=2560861 RepID=UPI001075609A|nr:chromate resistance protein ChrB domain-containing protein [Vitreimonas flagellata]